MSEILNGLGPSMLALILGLLFSIVYASLYHLWIGRSGRELLILLLMSLIGFVLGHAIGAFLQIELLRIGQLYALEGSIGAWLTMIGGHLAFINR